MVIGIGCGIGFSVALLLCLIFCLSKRFVGNRYQNQPFLQQNNENSIESLYPISIENENYVASTQV